MPNKQLFPSLMPRHHKRSATSWAGFFSALIGLVLVFPLLFTFDTMPLWKATLAASEYGHRLAIYPALIMILSWRGRRTRLGLATIIIATTAAVIFISPLISALVLVKQLPSRWQESGLGGQTAFSLQPTDLFFGKWTAKSETIPTVSYRYSEEHALDLLFYPSQSRAPAPCLVVIHGGGWRSGSPDEFQLWNAHWAAQGYAVAAIEYRLAPQCQWPAPLEDVQAALHYLKTNAEELGIRKDQFVILGRSAGGQIGTAAAYGLHDPSIIGCISLYAPADMFFAWKYADPADILDSAKLLRQYLGGDPEQQPSRYTSASGRLLVHAQAPPTLIIHGQRDALVWHLQSSRLTEALENAKVPHFYLKLPWATHGFDFAWQGPGSQISRQAIDCFLKSLKDTKNPLPIGATF